MAASVDKLKQLPTASHSDRDELARWVSSLDEKKWGGEKEMVQICLVPRQEQESKCQPLASKMKQDSMVKAQLLRIRGPQAGRFDIREKLDDVTCKGDLVPLTKTSNSFINSIRATSESNDIIVVEDTIDLKVAEGDVVYLYTRFQPTEATKE